MNDHTDAKLRELTYRLIEMAPEAPRLGRTLRQEILHGFDEARHPFPDRGQRGGETTP